MVVRVLIVDDSAFFVEAYEAALAHDPDIEVCGVAHDAADIVAVVERTRPDVISMDLHMPGIDGLEAVARVIQARRIPIVVMTGDPRGKDGSLCMQALARGAVDVVAKSDLNDPRRREVTCERLKAAANASLKTTWSSSSSPSPSPSSSSSSSSSRAIAVPHMRTPAPRLAADLGQGAPAHTVIGIAASTGGPTALAALLTRLPAGFAGGILVVQHLAPGFVQHLARWLGEVSTLSVAVARHGDVLRNGQLLLAPDDAQMSLGFDGAVRVDAQAAELGGHRPSATVLLSSIGLTRGVRAVGVVLSGMGRDGVDGLARIKAAGGATAAQDADSSVVDGMPRAARESGAASVTLALDEVAPWLQVQVERRR